MKTEQPSCQQIFHTFGIQPAYESSFCSLFKDGKRHFCVYHEKESEKIKCLYINELEYITSTNLLALLSPFQDIRYITLHEINHEYTFKEKVSSDFIVKWCYSIKEVDTDNNLPDAAREFIILFDKSKDIYLGEDHHVKIILRNKTGNVTDLLQYHSDDFETNFSNRFGSWEHRPDTSSLLHHLYTTHPYLISSFFEENNPYHYHTHIVSGYHFPEFTHLFVQMASDSDISLEPSFFLLGSLKNYIDFIGFLCHYATIHSKKNFFNIYPYTDHITLEMIPFDSPLGHTGLNFKSWQTMFSQKLRGKVNLNKWQTRAGIYTEIPLKIDILHPLCLDFIHLNKLSIRVINRVLDADSSNDQEPFNDLYDDQIF